MYNVIIKLAMNGIFSLNEKSSNFIRPSAILEKKFQAKVGIPGSKLNKSFAENRNLFFKMKIHELFIIKRFYNLHMNSLSETTLSGE